MEDGDASLRAVCDQLAQHKHGSPLSSSDVLACSTVLRRYIIAALDALALPSGATARLSSHPRWACSRLGLQPVCEWCTAAPAPDAYKVKVHGPFFDKQSLTLGPGPVDSEVLIVCGHCCPRAYLYHQLIYMVFRAYDTDALTQDPERELAQFLYALVDTIPPLALQPEGKGMPTLTITAVEDAIVDARARAVAAVAAVPAARPARVATSAPPVENAAAHRARLPPPIQAKPAFVAPTTDEERELLHINYIKQKHREREREFRKAAALAEKKPHKRRALTANEQAEEDEYAQILVSEKVRKEFREKEVQIKRAERRLDPVNVAIDALTVQQAAKRAEEERLLRRKRQVEQREAEATEKKEKKKSKPKPVKPDQSVTDDMCSFCARRRLACQTWAEVSADHARVGAHVGGRICGPCSIGVNKWRCTVCRRNRPCAELKKTPVPFAVDVTPTCDGCRASCDDTLAT